MGYGPYDLGIKLECDEIGQDHKHIIDIIGIHGNIR